MSASTASRTSAPAAVSSPSGPTSPRCCRRSTAASQSSSDQPRARRTSARFVRPVVASTALLSNGSSPAATQAVMWPSPRCSRRTAVSSHRSATASPVRATAAHAAPSGRPATSARAASAASRTTAPTDRDRRVERLAEVGAQRCGGRVDARRQHGRRVGEPPGVGQRALGHPRLEPVERGGDDGCADRTHRRGPPGEVAHPEALQADVLRGLRRLVGEVDDGVDRLDHLPEAAGGGTGDRGSSGHSLGRNGRGPASRLHGAPALARARPTPAYGRPPDAARRQWAQGEHG